MSKRISRLALLLLLSPLAWAWPASSGLSRPDAFAPVSKPWAVTLKKFARSQASRTYFNGTDFDALGKIDVNDPQERQLFAPWVKNLRDMKYTPRKLESLDAWERERFMSARVENAAVDDVQEVHHLRDAAADENAGIAKLSKTAEAIERISRIVGIHAPFKAGMLSGAYDKAQERLQVPR